MKTGVSRSVSAIGCLAMLWLQWGCTQIVVPGTVAGTGEVFRYARGSVVKQTYVGSMDQLTGAAGRALGKMGIELIRTESEDDETRLYAETQEMEIILRLNPITPTAIRVTIDTRKDMWLKDKATATAILDQIKAVMETEIAPMKRASSVYAKNECDEPIRVAIYYLYGPSGGKTWGPRGWFSVSPGARKQIADSENRYVYLYAESGGGRKLIWRGSEFHDFKGKTYGFFKVDMGQEFIDYTQTFTCD